MTRHPTQLQVLAFIAGNPPTDDLVQHICSCPECMAKVDAFKEEEALLLERFEMDGHPTRFQFLSYVLGDPVSNDVLGHLRSCPECIAKVEAHQKEHHAWLNTFDVDEFVDRVWTKAHESPSRRAFWSSKAHKRAPWIALASAVMILGMCMCFFLFQGHPPKKDPATNDVSLKGHLLNVTAYIKRHGGSYTPAAEAMYVSPGETVAVELKLSRKMEVTCGLLSDHGDWLPLVENKRLAAGVHRLPFALTLETHPLSGWLLSGTPSLIKEALKTRRFEHVVAIRIHSPR